MPSINRQRSACRVKFHPQDLANKRTIAQTGGKDKNRSVDITSLTTHKTLTTGGFNMQMVPRQEYFENIKADDWVEIFMDNGASGELPVMLACVDDVRRTHVTQANGVTVERIAVSGRDYSKVFLNTQIIVDPLVGALIDQATFNADVIVSKFSADGIPFAKPNEVLEALIKRYHTNRAQMKLPGSLQDKELRLSFDDTLRGKVIPNSHVNLGGNLWSLLNQFCNPLLNELYLDTLEDGFPVLVLREHPFSHDKFCDLRAVPYAIVGESPDDEMTKSGSDIRNWFRVHADGQFLQNELTAVANVGVANKESIARSGLHKMEETTLCFGLTEKEVSADNGVPFKFLQECAEQIAEWHWQNEELFVGSFGGRFRPDVRVGRRLDTTNLRSRERNSFYIESVTNNFVFPGPSTTRIGVTRGVRREEGSGGRFSFPLIQRTAKELLSQGILSTIETTKFEPTEGSFRKESQGSR